MKTSSDLKTLVAEYRAAETLFQGTRDRLQQAVETCYTRTKMSTQNIAELTGLSAMTIHKWLVLRGVKLRSAGRRGKK